MAEAGYIFGWDADAGAWVKVAVDSEGKLKTGESVTVDDTPVDGHTEEAISSNWAYDHSVDEDAHHARYTDAEAIAAVGLGGTRYHSIPGSGFIGQQSFSDDIDYSVTSGAVSCNVDNCALIAQVILPDGVTVTGAVVHGNAGAQAETWELRRVTLSSAANSQMATAAIGTEDTSIASEVIDNETYAYFLITSTLDTGDSVYGARISYEY